MDANLSQAEFTLARLDRLPRWPFHWYVLAIVGAAYFFCFFDIIIVGIALPEITKEFHASQSAAAWVITSSLIGYITGSFLVARLSDYCGRRLSLFVSVFLYVIGAILCATSINLHSLIVWRSINGLGLGAEIACSVTYISELAPSHIRGRMAAYAAAFGFLGFAITPFIGIFFLVHLHWSWRILFIISAMGGGVTLLLRSLIPKSPRWLATHGKLSEAKKIVDRAEAFFQKRHPAPLPPVETPNNNTQGLKKPYLRDLIFSKYFPRLVLLILIFAFYYMGNYGWLILMPTLLMRIGFSFAHSLEFVGIFSAGFIIGSGIAIYLTDKVERKWLCFSVAIIWSTCLLLVGFFPNEVVVAIFGFIACASISTIMPIMYLYAAENFPTAHRATGVSLSDGLGHIGGAFCGQIIYAFYYLFSTPQGSFAAALTTMAVSGLIAAILFPFGIRMTKRSLNKVE